MNRRTLRKSGTDRSISGVCGGIAEFCGISALGIRLIFLVTLPLSAVVYLILVNTMNDSGVPGLRVR
ncbi:PspC domain-containing protein [Alteribacter natronophilus]|uniref:PspC domain-containing protein n=1 Tax=Alteribacter natronophilus TaxID=2583810 RepID=UPI00110D3C71|nr:PspC domain-containing protein [Alteribacter natronophilus]TMW72881.1 PspC domain-containing protein [Alteribacter natronophilus]